MGEGRTLGSKLLMFDVLGSTSVMLGELAADGEAEGTVVVAEEQSAGRGRLGRGWSSPKGGLWFSVLLRPAVPPSESPKLTLMAGVAVARALKNTIGLEARLKWPNDVLVQGKKLCGILSQSRCGDRVEYVILGVGINANFLLSVLPEELRQSATTVRELLQRTVDRHALLRAILRELETAYAPFCAGDHQSIVAEWKALAETLGKPVRVETSTGMVEGTAEDIDGRGALVVRTAGGYVTVPAGDCLHVDD